MEAVGWVVDQAVRVMVKMGQAVPENLEELPGYSYALLQAQVLMGLHDDDCKNENEIRLRSLVCGLLMQKRLAEVGRELPVCTCECSERAYKFN